MSLEIIEETYPVLGNKDICNCVSIKNISRVIECAEFFILFLYLNTFSALLNAVLAVSLKWREMPARATKFLLTRIYVSDILFDISTGNPTGEDCARCHTAKITRSSSVGAGNDKVSVNFIPALIILSLFFILSFFQIYFKSHKFLDWIATDCKNH